MSNNNGTVRELHAKITQSIESGGPDLPELYFAQKVRASAAGAVFAACRPHFTPEDEDDLGYMLSQIAGWVLYGNNYDPDLDEGMVSGLKGKGKAA